MRGMASVNRSRWCTGIKRAHPYIQMRISLMTSKSLAKSLTHLFKRALRLSPKCHSTNNKFTSHIHSMRWDLSSTIVPGNTLEKKWRMHRVTNILVISSNNNNRSRCNSSCKIRINTRLLNSKCMSRSNKILKWSTSQRPSRKEWSSPNKSRRKTCT